MISADPRSPAFAVPHAIRQALLGVSTCLPGEVISYDATTRRARVQPAISLLMDDETTVDRPIVADVPVVWPMCRTFMLTGVLEQGDPVLLVMSQRGLERWKVAHANAPPGGGMHDLKDAIAIPGLGPVGAFAPANRVEVTDSGISITGTALAVTAPFTVNAVPVANASAGTGVAGNPAHSHTLTVA